MKQNLQKIKNRILSLELSFELTCITEVELDELIELQGKVLQIEDEIETRAKLNSDFIWHQHIINSVFEKIDAITAIA